MRIISLLRVRCFIWWDGFEHGYCLDGCPFSWISNHVPLILMFHQIVFKYSEPRRPVVSVDKSAQGIPQFKCWSTLKARGFRSVLIWMLLKSSYRVTTPFVFVVVVSGHNQTLEFLGDTVLQFISSEYLFKHFPDHHEGHLTVSWQQYPQQPSYRSYFVFPMNLYRFFYK